MTTLRIFLILGFLSCCSLSYLRAQSAQCNVAAMPTKESLCTENKAICPTATAQNILPSEHFLSKCLEKMVESISISNLLTIEEPKPTIITNPNCVVRKKIEG